MDEGSPVWAGDESAAGPGWACNFRSSLGWVSGDQDPASCTHLSAVLSPADPQRTLLRSSVSTPRGSFLPLACTPPRTGRSLPRRRLSSTIRRFSMFRTAAPGTQAGPHRRLGRTPEPAPSFACSFCPRLPRPGPPTPSSFPVSSNLRPFSPSCARVPSPLATSLPLPVPHPCTAPPTTGGLQAASGLVRRGTGTSPVPRQQPFSPPRTFFGCFLQKPGSLGRSPGAGGRSWGPGLLPASSWDGHSGRAPRQTHVSRSCRSGPEAPSDRLVSAARRSRQTARLVDGGRATRRHGRPPALRINGPPTTGLRGERRLPKAPAPREAACSPQGVPAEERGPRPDLHEQRQAGSLPRCPACPPRGQGRRVGSALSESLPYGHGHDREPAVGRSGQGCGCSGAQEAGPDSLCVVGPACPPLWASCSPAWTPGACAQQAGPQAMSPPEPLGITAGLDTGQHPPCGCHHPTHATSHQVTALPGATRREGPTDRSNGRW